MSSKKPKDEIAPTQQDGTFKSESPLLNPTDDLLGYAPFAKLLANAILTAKADLGLVVGLHGPWGSGKSTVLNFVKQYIAERASTTAEHGNIVSMDFNPWMFHGSHHSLVAKYLEEFLKVLAPKSQKASELMRSVAEFLGSVIESEEVSLLSDLEPSTKTAAWLGNKVLKRLTKRKSLQQLKAKISKLLSASNDKIVVFIDDMDRLEVSEIKQMFQLVKAVADFPNVIYVLAFDRGQVEKAINQPNYLEKIIQCPFELPVVSPNKIRNFFEHRLLQIPGAEEGKFDRERWHLIYSDGLRHLLTTPRKVQRFLNSLSLTIPALRNEVDLPDLIGLEAIRVFIPEFYSLIRSNKREFAGANENDTLESNLGDLLTASNKSAPKFHQEWIERFRKYPYLQGLVLAIFQNLNFMFRPHPHHDNSSELWLMGLRACSPNRFNIYFAFTVHDDQLSNSELNQILNSVDSINEFGKTLHDVTKNDSKFDFLEAGLYTAIRERWSATECIKMMDAFCTVADQIYFENRGRFTGVFGVNVSFRLVRLFLQAFNKVDRADRLKLLLRLVQVTTARHFLIEVIQQIESSRGNGIQIISDEELSKVKQAIATAIESDAKEGVLFQDRDIWFLIKRWNKWGDVQSLKNFFDSILQNKELLTALLLELVSKGQSRSGRMIVSHDYEYIDPHRIPEFFRESFEQAIKNFENIKDVDSAISNALALYNCGKEAINNGEIPSDPVHTIRRLKK